MDDATRRSIIARSVAIAMAVVGLWGLGTWWLGRPDWAGLVPGSPPVLPGTAAWMLLCAGAIHLDLGRALLKRAALACALLSLALALAMLLMLLGGWGSFLPLPNGLTGLSMALVSLSLALRDHPWRPELDPSAMLAILGQIAPYFALTGYALQVTELYRPERSNSMALATALLLIGGAMASLASRPARRVMAWWHKDSLGGTLLRRQVPMVLLAPALLGMLVVAGEHGNLYSREVSVGLILVISGLTGALHTSWTSRSLDDLEAAQAVTMRDLQASEAMFRGLMESASDAILVVDEQGRIAFKNRQVATMFGYEPEELLGMAIDQLVPDRFRAAHGSLVGAYFAGPWHRDRKGLPDLYGRRKDGSEFPAEISLSPLESVEGRFVMVLLRDLTEQRRSAEAIAQLNAELQRRNEEIEAEIAARTAELARQNDLVQQVIRNVPAGIAMVDPDLAFRWANPEYPRQLGMDHDQLLASRLADVVPGLDGGRLDLESLRSGQTLRLIGAPLVRDGVTTFWDASLVPFFANDCYQGCILLANEVTAHIELERMQQDHIQALERADALKDEFLNIVSHELRTPLAILSGTLSLFAYEVDGPLNDSQRRDVARMRESTEHLLTLVNDLLDISMIQAGRLTIVPRPLHVGDLVEAAVDIVRPLASARRITVRTELDPDLPEVSADGQRIRQVIINLLGNALKFSPSESSVEIRVRREAAGLRCEVSDEGPGVALQDHERIFEKFTRLEGGADQDGAGLGLYICRALVELHGGGLGVDSDGRNGSTFWFSLPRR